MSVRIIVDSTTDLRPQAARRVQVVPLTIHFGEREFVDGVDIDTDRFYRMLVQSDVLPTTSQPTPHAFGKVFAQAVEAGDSVVCITISAKLSGTFQSASIAAADYPGKVFVVDSRNVTIAAGVLVEYALELVDQGMSAEHIALTLMEKRDKVKLLAMVDTLEYLKKGGRISATVAFAGGLLNIKPLITIDDGEVKMVSKARGVKQAYGQLAELIGKAGGVDFSKPVMLGYTGIEDTLLKKYMEESASFWSVCGGEPPYAVIGSVVGTHAGPGAVAAAFFTAE